MSEPRIARADLINQLGASLGVEKAEDEVAVTSRLLGLNGDTFSIDETMRLLETLAKTAGLVGTVARFAKVRLLLRGGQ